jgi:hypothetical protein
MNKILCGLCCRRANLSLEVRKEIALKDLKEGLNQCTVCKRMYKITHKFEVVKH